jgi:hypothetical protein
MLRLTRRELETDPQGTAPVLDPTLGGLGAAMPCGYPVSVEIWFSEYMQALDSIKLPTKKS